MRDKGPADPAENPFHRVTADWRAVVEDMHATASDYREAGWTAVTVHPGDVTVLTGEPRTAAEQTGESEPEPRRLGFDVVVPGDEFEAFQAAMADRSIEECTVFAATGSGVVYLVVALEAADRETVGIVPLYYDESDREALVDAAREYGLYTHVRPLQDDTVVTVEHEAFDPFFPEVDSA
ncbi:hypothetical protein C475_07525 [Halosimplex carlsbadense 2-9-1]|uniref:Uncharacterized protein n=1 Tax=Halosimplex carlsbadense 2-9-1 TaxID=797114 RepID=M0CYN0_9EURY|nr:hypothetical protein [Halosimplex carlsbadense]ELZ27753.1 hypothetical protein C475_07525 [Halosimplex carlsbadense 2-9-1]